MPLDRQHAGLTRLETALLHCVRGSAAAPRGCQQRSARGFIVSLTPAVLVSIDGMPVLRPSAGGFMKVINSRR